MEFKEIQDLLKLVNRTNLTEVEIEKKDFKIKIRRKSPESNVIYTTQQSAAPVAVPSAVPVPITETAPVVPKPESKPAPPKEEAEAPSESLYEFRSPMIGTFYRSPNPEAPPFVKVGDHVQKGQVVCIVEAMKLFNEIESEVDGKVVKILLDNAQPVEYDQVLFLIDTNA
ncbi:MAG: acetyl-CoA carboxylase biotin carboxyl carrier protein [Bacteroidetes bacterium]|nr:MAG: acetyl-CoA carboxylase biotin carboxyl carrier protein [Bacteroidota bacterium]